MNSASLNGKIILITGAAGLLGKHFVDFLKGAGAEVISTDIVPGSWKLDVTDQAQIDLSFSQIVQSCGEIHVVVNCAAINPTVEDLAKPGARTFCEYPEAAMMQAVQVNQLGTWRVCKTAVRYFMEKGSGNIVNIASVYGVVPPRQEIYSVGSEKPVDYSMTKAAVIMLTRHIASQFGPRVRCNALAPGGVFNNQTDTDFISRYSAMTSLKRMSSKDEVAAALAFLCSDASAGMTGETLHVDGGIVSR